MTFCFTQHIAPFWGGWLYPNPRNERAEIIKITLPISLEAKTIVSANVTGNKWRRKICVGGAPIT